ncbi:hypothetical protein FFL34_18055 [Lentibacillus cibarius]|uniref:Uncharacterized protein n=1 Tax=Lentibacillus cibarius TaxID=2583219 RepID=A0A5S3QFM3_9BACI|nr:hypothetical protein FFL34_18055 [Lentibacillus cibarius]
MVLEILKEEKAMSQIASEHGIHVNSFINGNAVPARNATGL